MPAPASLGSSAVVHPAEDSIQTGEDFEGISYLRASRVMSHTVAVVVALHEEVGSACINSTRREMTRRRVHHLQVLYFDVNSPTTTCFYSVPHAHK